MTPLPAERRRRATSPSSPAQQHVKRVVYLSTTPFRALINEATVDCYSEDEQVTEFAVMIGDNLAVPFETTVLGVTVTVEEVCQTGSGIVATCVRGKHRQAIPILDLPLPTRRREARNGSRPTAAGRN